MIILTIDPWCDNCKEFEPHVEQDVMYGDDEIDRVFTDITCKHRHRCQNIKNFIEHQK